VSIAYAVDLARKSCEAIGFIPVPRLEQYHQRGQILYERENDALCGYLCFGTGWPALRIYQAVIQYDARRREHGFALVARVIAIAQKRGCHAISLWCAQDLDANAFWQAAGFRCIAKRVGGVRRGRLHNQWMLAVETPQLALLP